MSVSDDNFKECAFLTDTYFFRHGLMLPWFKDFINVTEK